MSSEMKPHVFALFEDRGKVGVRCPAPFPVGDAPSKPNANDVLDVWHGLHRIHHSPSIQVPIPLVEFFFWVFCVALKENFIAK